MTITASDFRDASLSAVVIGYDWERSEHFAQLALLQPGLAERTYRIEGLTSWSAFEDFAAQYIERCTLLVEPGSAYLCLDPFRENERSPQDNFWFVGTRLTHGAEANNSFKPKPLRGSA